MDFVLLFKTLISLLTSKEYFPVERFALLGDEPYLENFAENFQTSILENVFTSYIVCSKYVNRFLMKSNLNDTISH
jgi:hypothetical protein